MKGRDHRAPPGLGPPGLGQGSRPLWPLNLQTGDKVLLRGAHQVISPAHDEPGGVTKESPRSVLLCILSEGSTASSLV